MRKIAIFLAVTLALIGGGFLLGYQKGKGDTPEPVIVRDTVTRIDTFRIENPVIVERTIRDTIEVQVSDTVFVSLPREEVRYQDSTYSAIVSGIRPSLDYLEVYPKTQTITVHETIVVPKNRRWGVGLQAGYGITPKGLQPYLGIGISYNLAAW